MGIHRLGNDHAEAQDLSQDEAGRVLDQLLADFHEKSATLKLALEKLSKRESAFTTCRTREKQGHSA